MLLGLVYVLIMILFKPILGPWSNIFTSICIVADNIAYSRPFIKDVTRQYGSSREIAFTFRRTYRVCAWMYFAISFFCAFLAVSVNHSACFPLRAERSEIGPTNRHSQ